MYPERSGESRREPGVGATKRVCDRWREIELGARTETARRGADRDMRFKWEKKRERDLERGYREADRRIEKREEKEKEREREKSALRIEEDTVCRSVV